MKALLEMKFLDEFKYKGNIYILLPNDDWGVKDGDKVYYIFNNDLKENLNEAYKRQKQINDQKEPYTFKVYVRDIGWQDVYYEGDIFDFRNYVIEENNNTKYATLLVDQSLYKDKIEKRRILVRKSDIILIKT